MVNNNYRHFYSVLKAKLKPYRDAKQHLDRFLSADFNVFKWIGPDENRRSDIIADLLNPSGSHGQQHRFLDAFLQAIKRPDLKTKKLLQADCRVQTDHNSENPRGQMDILVEFEHFGLAIENKVGAKEQLEQLYRYYVHLKNKYGKDGFCLVYLTPEGEKPTSIKDPLREELMGENKLICISYNHDMLKWLEECCRLCESDKFQWFLRDFMDYINGGQTMSMRNERDIILKHALESEENLKTALDIGFAFSELQNGGLQKSELQKRIIVGFLNKLEKFVLDELGNPDESKWNVSDDLRCYPLTRYRRFSFGEKTWGNQYGVALEPHQTNACDVRIGVWRQYDEDTKKGAPKFQPEDLLKKALDAEIRNGKRSDHWEWYLSLDNSYQNWNTKEALIRLHNGDAVEYIGQELVRIIDKAAPIIDEHIRGSE